MTTPSSQQEPKCLAALCKLAGDSQLYNVFMSGKELYVEIASKSFHQPYLECIEHFPKGTPIKYNKETDKWYYATEDDYDKLADGENDTYADGKARRSQAKVVLLSILYGKDINNLAQDLECSIDEAQSIKDSVFKTFPAIKKFEDDSLQMAKDIGYVTTICGNKRRLPDLQLDEFEFSWKDGYNINNDPLDFEEFDGYVPDDIANKYLTRLQRASFKQKLAIKEEAEKNGIIIKDNGKKIADATRKCVNARIQGSASNLTKAAMIKLYNNPRVKEIGMRILIPIHDRHFAQITCRV